MSLESINLLITILASAGAIAGGVIAGLAAIGYWNRARFAMAQEAIDIAKEAQALAEQHAAQQDKRIEDLEQVVARSRERINALERREQELLTKIAALMSEVLEQQRRNKELQEENERLKRELELVRKELELMRKELESRVVKRQMKTEVVEREQ